MRGRDFGAAVAAFGALASPSHAVTFDCKHVVVDSIPFDLSKLGGPKLVHNIEEEWPTLSNHTFNLDICSNLPIEKKAKNKLNCSSGTRICYTKYDYNVEDGTNLVERVYPIAGTFDASNGKSLDPYITRLKNSASHKDAEREGLRVELNGGYSSNSKQTSRDQQAIIEFECDRNRTGLEGSETGKTGDVDDDAASSRTKLRRAEADDDKDADPEVDAASLRFISYKAEGDKLDVLRLLWRTKYACEKRAGDPASNDTSAHWGVFTWFLIIVFMVTAAYLIFGSWLNYSRYGARGWDLLPHGDTLRNLPYAFKEWVQSVSNAVGGQGSRGGYSAV